MENILDSIDRQKLGKLLLQARQECGMTQGRAAREANIAIAAIIAIEGGERRIPARELIGLARAYDRSVADFVAAPRPQYPRHLAIEAFDRGLITEGYFADLLGVDRLKARIIASGHSH